MNTILIAGGAVAVVVIGAYLRWGVRPAMAAYRIGRTVGRMR